MTTDIPFSPVPTPVDFLILGAGWTSNFLIPLLKERKIPFAATSRSGHDKTLKFTFDPHSTTSDPFDILPNASTVLITFPIYGAGGSKRLLEFYKETHPEAVPHFIQLGSTGIYDVSNIIRLPGYTTHVPPGKFHPEKREEGGNLVRSPLLIQQVKSTGHR